MSHICINTLLLNIYIYEFKNIFDDENMWFSFYFQQFYFEIAWGVPTVSFFLLSWFGIFEFQYYLMYVLLCIHVRKWPITNCETDLSDVCIMDRTKRVRKKIKKSNLILFQ